MYYTIKNQVEASKIGCYPQVQTYLKFHDSDNRGSMTNLGRCFFSNTPDIEIDMDGIVLQKKAKLTDYLTTSYLNGLTGMLISRKLYDVLLKLNCIDYLVYPANIYNEKGEVLDIYYYIHFNKNYPEYIDFEESKIFRITDDDKKVYVPLKSLEDYNKFKQSHPTVLLNAELATYYPIVRDYNLFRDSILFSRPLIDQMTYNLMLDFGITGIDYIEINNISFST